jgi:hypothetical protein
MGPPAIPCPANHAPNETAVEGHPSVPDGEDFKRMGKISRQVVEEHITQPRADHKAKNDVGIEGLEEIAAER